MRKSSFMWLFISIVTTFILIQQMYLSSSSITAINRFFGLEAIFLIIVSLSIGPIITLKSGFSELHESRRAVGISSFVFLFAHFFITMQTSFNFDPSYIFLDNGLIIGFIAYWVLLIVTITSMDYAIKKLGQKNWKRVQRLTYIAIILAIIHFLAQSNGLLAGNLSEILILIFTILMILLQIIGFLKKRKVINNK